MEFLEFVKQLGCLAKIVHLVEDADGQVREDLAIIEYLYFVSENVSI